MKIFNFLIVIGCLLICATNIGAQDLSKYDLSTDEGVNLARAAINGEQVDDHSKSCIERNIGSPKIVAVGNFRYDYGCRFAGVFVNSKYFKKDDSDLSKKAFDALGWKTANVEERQKLARAWTETGLLGFTKVIGETNAEFQEKRLKKPQTSTAENGETTVTVWIKTISDVMAGHPKAYLTLLEYKFAKDGGLLGKKSLKSLKD